MAAIGYARVATRDQDLTIQREALTAAGCSKIYAEKIGGAKSDRPQLARLLRALASPDLTSRDIVPTFPATLTTIALNDSSLRWFEVCT